jgi:tRNA1(Val) A37 N6-methylase TrmN6
VHLCSKSGLFASRKNTVFSTEKKQPNRILLQFNKKTQHIVNQTITIRKNNIYTNEYLELTKDFYLFA